MSKPKLVPVSVPWMIESGAPNLSLQNGADNLPVSATFSAYFKLDDVQTRPSTKCQIVKQLIEFVPTPLEARSAYRLVRVNFFRAKAGRISHSYSDREVIKKEDYDWSEVPGRLSDEKPETYVKRMIS